MSSCLLEKEIRDVVFERESYAEEVLYVMKRIVDIHGYATVADFFDIVGEYSSYDYNFSGWYDLDEAYITDVKNGYIIEFGTPTSISRN